MSPRQTCCKGASRRGTALVFVLAGLALAGCQVTEEHRTVPVDSVATRGAAYTGPKYKLAIGKVANRSPYLNGLFSDGTDRLGMQARQILMTHLTQSNHFVLLDRLNLDELATEAKLAGTPQALEGAQFVVTGAVTEFGRRETGDVALGGILGKSRKQLAYAKLSLTMVDVATSRTLYSIQGAGEYELNNQEVLGFGSKAGYDATLTDKVINLAAIDVVNKLVDGLERGEWGLGK